MAVQHNGNVQNQLLMEEHDGVQNAKRVTLASSNATIYAVVNTSASGGNVTVQQGTTPWVSSILGNITLSDPNTYIGLTTTTLGVGTRYIGLVTSTQNGLVTLAASPNFIGLVTITGNVGISGNVTLSNPNAYIGLTTTTLGIGDRFIGLVTVGNTINANVSLGASAQFIGIVTVANRDIIGNVTLADAKTYIGLTTTTLGAGDRFIGLVTAISRNAGTTKTLISLPVTLSVGSIATIAIPTNTFKMTHLLLNSNATVRLNIKSGVTYLTGNASLGINLSPTGGWVENGSPDSPIYLGLTNAAAIVVEKADSGGLIAQVAGKIIYFDE